MSNRAIVLKVRGQKIFECKAGEFENEGPMLSIVSDDEPDILYHLPPGWYAKVTLYPDGLTEVSVDE